MKFLFLLVICLLVSGCTLIGASLKVDGPKGTVDANLAGATTSVEVEIPLLEKLLPEKDE